MMHSLEKKTWNQVGWRTFCSSYFFHRMYWIIGSCSIVADYYGILQLFRWEWLELSFHITTDALKVALMRINGTLQNCKCLRWEHTVRILNQWETFEGPVHKMKEVSTAPSLNSLILFYIGGILFPTLDTQEALLHRTALLDLLAVAHDSNAQNDA